MNQINNKFTTSHFVKTGKKTLFGRTPQ